MSTTNCATVQEVDTIQTSSSIRAVQATPTTRTRPVLVASSPRSVATRQVATREEALRQAILRTG